MFPFLFLFRIPIQASFSFLKRPFLAYLLSLIKSAAAFGLLFFLCAFQALPYKHVILPGPLSIHILEVDPQAFSITLVHAKEKALGRQTVQELADAYGALAAINGGFFKGSPWEGLPAGILKIQSQWYAWPTKPRGALGWNPDGRLALIDQVLCKASCQIQDKVMAIDGLNRQRNEQETILFSPQFHSTTLTNEKGFEVVVRQNRLFAVYEGGSHAIPWDGFILSFGSKVFLKFWRTIPLGSPINLQIHTHSQSSYTPSHLWDSLSNIVGGAPVLIRGGEVIRDFSSEQTRSSFLNSAHARTAVGLLPNGHWLLVVVDGRQPKLSKGMTIPELASFMHSLGCQEALNLDGGGSSTMVIDHHVVNDPTGDEDEDEGLKKVRKVSDAILILERA
ncbi:phosphodiester glycosidase family protein [Candidatus Protochlamydia phocaeensis]|uniref:phosphodiester glycosidase family protein n=1 Tax=Candidatus Protochlamydia phocaeensis TaxID=1414722 RepID=UPI0008383FDA|nr:phosphodiester glycosidase family protein [Candidatus Protochlamydia phocaeensis]